MAYTASCILLLLAATLFVLNTATPTPVQDLKNYIGDQVGKMKAEVNTEIGQTARQAQMAATTPEQQKCIGMKKGELFKTANTMMNEEIKKMMNLADSHQADINNASESSLHKAVDSILASWKKQVQSEMEELKNC